jgi:hypothetical protein
MGAGLLSGDGDKGPLSLRDGVVTSIASGPSVRTLVLPRGGRPGPWA